IDIVDQRKPTRKEGDPFSGFDPILKAQGLLKREGIRARACCQLMGRFRRAPQASGKPYNKAEVDKLIADLESDKFATRMKATEELEKFGGATIPFLEKYIREQRPALEHIVRLEEVITQIKKKGAIAPAEENALRILLTSGLCDRG